MARKRDALDFLMVVAAVVADGLAVWGGFWIAAFLRFHSGLIPMFHDGYPDPSIYSYGALIGMLLIIFIFRNLELYRRPQTGSFVDIIPRLVRAIGLGILVSMVLAFVVHTEPQVSRVVVGLSFGSILLFVLIERYVLFQVELRIAKRQKSLTRLLVVGTDEVAIRLRTAVEQEPRLRTKVVGFVSTGREVLVPQALIAGSLDDIDSILDLYVVNQVVVADTSLGQEQRMEIFLYCDKKMIDFRMVPSVFGVLTSKVEVSNLAGVSVIGLGKWPLDYFWNRLRKRCLDIVGAGIGLLISGPIILCAAWLIKKQSPGPVFYGQERCGEEGRLFRIFKLRTMHPDAEEKTGPVWASADDDRRIPVGRFLRSYNLDELPQFWNVLRGEMSLVGPRPERPFFVAQFKEDIGRYMWRHAIKPGMTGWAQVNGFRGNSSIQERLKYDLYYLENWSLSFDLKIIARTFFCRKNAY